MIPYSLECIISMFIIFKFCYTFSRCKLITIHSFTIFRGTFKRKLRFRKERKATRVCNFLSNIVCIFEKKVGKEQQILNLPLG